MANGTHDPQADRGTMNDLTAQLAGAHTDYIEALHEGADDLDARREAIRDLTEQIRARMDHMRQLVHAAEKAAGLSRPDHDLVKIPLLTSENIDEFLEHSADHPDEDET